MRILLPTMALLGAVACQARAQELSELSLPPNGDNQRAEVSQWIGPVQVTIRYHSPRVHLRGTQDRTDHIYGGVVQYGFFDDGFGPSHATPWRVGANESTEITFSDDVKFEGHDLKAGTYALFLELEKSGPWTWILSTQIGWGGYQYDPKFDVLRAPVTPQDAPFTEFLTFGFDNRLPDGAQGYLQWEKKRVPFQIGVPNVDEVYASRMRQELLTWPGFNYRNWQTAAQFCADRKVNLEEALVWANRAIHEPFRNATVGSEAFSTYETKAAVLYAMGRQSEGDASMDTALVQRDADATPVYGYGMRLLAEGRTGKALSIFKLNRQKHPTDDVVTSVGLARGYAATGDTARAIKSWEAAIAHIPPNLEANRAAYEKALQELKTGAAGSR